MKDFLPELRNIVYAILMLAAVYMGHYATIRGWPQNVQCFAPVSLEDR